MFVGASYLSFEAFPALGWYLWALNSSGMNLTSVSADLVIVKAEKGAANQNAELKATAVAGEASVKVASGFDSLTYVIVG